MKNKDKKMMLFVIATIVTSLGIGYTLLRGTRATTETPPNAAFDDMLFYQCVVNAYNAENDTEYDYTTYSLSDEELQDISRLSCFADMDIVSVKGIEKMTSLTSLDMHYNKLSTIDLSNNVSLTYVRLSDNQLTSLDVSKNINLTQLDVSGNQISDIKLEDVTTLVSLDISDNDLSSLNVKNNAALKTLDASNNQLTSLDVTNNTLLTTLELSINQLTELDVSKNTELTTLVVGADNYDTGGGYDGYGNQLVSLDVTNNTKLQKLAASNNQLTSLDVSHNTELSELSLYGNQLTELNLDSNTKLKILNLGFAYGCGNTFSGLGCGRNYGNNISSIDLTNNINLEELFISNNQLQSIDLSNNKNLVYIQLTNNQIESLDVSGFENLSKLTVDENNLSSLNLKGSNNITILFADKNNLTELDVAGLSKLKWLVASDNKIQSLNLIDNQSLHYLDMDDNQLSELDLTKNENLALLFVSNNKLEDLDLSNNLNLERVYVNNNQLSSLDTSKNTSLKYLNIDDNPYAETLYVYKGDTITIGNNVKIPSHLGWETPTWEVNDTNIVAMTEAGLINGLEIGNTDINGVVKNKYTTNSTVNVVEITSDEYYVNSEENYIYVGINDDVDTIKTSIDVSNENVVLDVDLDNNKLFLKFEDKIFKEFKIVRLSSSVYDIEKEYIYVGNSELNLDSITFFNATAKIEDNVLMVMVNENVVDQIKIVSFDSELYTIGSEYVYVASNTFDIKNIDLVNAVGTLENNKLIIKYNDNLLDEYEIIGFQVNDYLVKGKRIVIDTEIDYDTFMSNITSSNSSISFEIYNSDELVTLGNVSVGMNLKVLYGGIVLDEYIITDEYLEFNSDVAVNENKLIVHDIAIGTSVSDIISSVDSNGSVNVYDKDDNLISDNTSKLKTGDKLKIEFSGFSLIYTISVTGDVTGDGDIDVSDVEMVSEHVLDNSIISGDEYLLASDYDNNGSININDIIKMADYVINNG